MSLEQGDSALFGQRIVATSTERPPAENIMSEERPLSVRIAVAEDEPDIRKTFVKLLELMGHKVVYSVSNGAELLEQRLDDQVDVVFVDLDMPVMDGLAAAEEVTQKGIPVILVSGHPDSESVVVDQEPVVTRITKPASPGLIRDAIEQAMASRRAKPR
jgi:two-component system, response regulator PdtaR